MIVPFSILLFLPSKSDGLTWMNLCWVRGHANIRSAEPDTSKPAARHSEMGSAGATKTG